MAKKKEFSEGKKNIIAGLLEKYDIETAEDIQEALKDLLGGTIQSMMEAELSGHLGYEKSERSDSSNARNGTKPKKLRSQHGEIPIMVPQDRNSEFESKIVPKRKKDISTIEGKIISMYARGLTTRQTSAQIDEIYGFDVPEGMVSDITNKLLPEIEEWQNRPLSSIYPIVFIDAIHFSVRDNGMIKNSINFICFPSAYRYICVCYSKSLEMYVILFALLINVLEFCSQLF